MTTTRTFAQGFMDELCMRQTVCGVSTMNVENVLSTLAHCFIPACIAKVLRRQLYPERKSVFEKAFPKVFDKTPFVKE